MVHRVEHKEIDLWPTPLSFCKCWLRVHMFVANLSSQCFNLLYWVSHYIWDHVTANNNAVFFFISALKIVNYVNYKSLITMPSISEENILRHYLFGDKIIQNYLKIDATYLNNNDLLLRQETQKTLHVLEANIIKICRVQNDRHCACLINKSL